MERRTLQQRNIKASLSEADREQKIKGMKNVEISAVKERERDRERERLRRRRRRREGLGKRKGEEEERTKGRRREG